MKHKIGIVFLLILSIFISSCNHSTIKTVTVTTHSMINHFGEPQIDTTLACEKRVYEYDQAGKITKETVFWDEDVFYMYKFSYNEDNIFINYYENNSGTLVNRYIVTPTTGNIESILVEPVSRGEKMYEMDKSKIIEFVEPEWASYVWSIFREDTDTCKYTYDSKTGLMTSYSYYMNYEVREVGTMEYVFW